MTITVREPQNVTHARPPLGRRIAPRRRLAVPVNVTVLRSGVPDAVPGRCVDVCEGGVGAVLAAELFPGELVGVEFLLPDARPVLAKAHVCYQERLRCGLQFLAIPPEQREMLGAWTLQEPQRTTRVISPAVPVVPAKSKPRLLRCRSFLRAHPPFGCDIQVSAAQGPNAGGGLGDSGRRCRLVAVGAELAATGVPCEWAGHGSRPAAHRGVAPT